MADMITNSDRKWIEKEDHEYASKGVAGTALGIGIGALALTVLGRTGLNNILGTSDNNTSSCGCAVTCSDRLADTKQTYADMFGLYKGYRDMDDVILSKHNSDAFQLYKYSRDGFDALKNELDNLKTKVLVNEAIEPWKNKSIMDAIALERERRESADCSIVGYTNCTFIPQYIADMTPATTSQQKLTRNPLDCGC